VAALELGGLLAATRGLPRLARRGAARPRLHLDQLRRRAAHGAVPAGAPARGESLDLPSWTGGRPAPPAGPQRPFDRPRLLARHGLKPATPARLALAILAVAAGAPCSRAPEPPAHV